MPVFKMEFNGYSVQFSPFDDRLAVGAAQNFGIIGNGKQYVLQVSFVTAMQRCLSTYETMRPVELLICNTNHVN